MEMAAQFPTPFKGWHTDQYPAIDPTRPELSLKGMAAIVTGGGGAIGGAIAHALAKAGISLIGIVGRTQKNLEETISSVEATYNTKVVAVAADIASLSSLDAAFKAIGAHSEQPIDILIANAGFISPGRLIISDPDDWWTAFDINSKGAFNTLRAFLPIARQNATILNVSSCVAHFPIDIVPNISAYTASKLAAVKIFEYIAAENPTLHVQFHPGAVVSDMSSKCGDADIPCPDSANLPGCFAVWLCSAEAAFLKNKLVWANWDVEEMKAKAGLIQGSSLFTMGLFGWPKFE